jgi:hypothetical protein
MIYASSHAAYNTLLKENVLCLPSVSTLKKVVRRVYSTRGLDNANYLKMRVAKLNEYERTCLLMIDEIYIAKRIEYSGGEVQGLTADGTVASTLLCFMVKSLVSKYRDIVAIYPMSKLTAAKQFDCYKEVAPLLQNVLLKVVAISVDNATANRKFFSEFLCQGTLRSNVIDPVTGQPVYLIFDPVHDIKNVYNNFQSRKLFQCPPMIRNLPDGCTANFHHLVELFNLELTMPLKKAHRLSPTVLAPKNIEKTSAKLATSVFNESTRDALRFYAVNEGKAEWSGTAEFIALILKLWNVMNVKFSMKGKFKHDCSMDPIRRVDDWKLEFLTECADFLQSWEASGKPGLTRETFLALRQTCLSLRDCAIYLLSQHGFNYVLLGRLQSDDIESRFGWLRQLSGANYYVSMRQVLESDRKIRALSLTKFSGYSLAEIDEGIDSQSSAVEKSVDTSTADFIADTLTYQTWPTASDASIIYYVSGAVARSAVRSTRCDQCKSLLTDPEQIEPIQLDEGLALDYSAAAFLDAINRGGLSKPSDYTFTLCVNSWRVYKEMQSSAELTSRFLSSSNQRSIFLQVMDRATTTDGVLLAEENFCVKGHDLKTLIVRRIFNCLAKNLVKDLTNKATTATDETGKIRRKISKLSSNLRAD